MRTRVVWLSLVLSPALFCVQIVYAQNAGVMAAQQAAEQAQIANQQAMQAAQQANQQATDAARQANEQATRDAQQAATNTQIANMQHYFPLTDRPKFSVKPGSYSSVLTVKIRDNTRGAIIYYTTDGWTPTAESTRYTGPITIDSTSTLQAIAIAPGERRSPVAAGVYRVSAQGGAAANAQASGVRLVSTDATGKVVIPRGTALLLLFASDLTSRTADVGDKITLTLAEDIQAGDRVLLHKGAFASGTVTETDKSHAQGVPGELIFKVESIAQDGTVIKLRGSAAKEGQDKYAKTAAALVPVIGPFALLGHGEEAEIKQGTPFTAYVDTDTVLTPKN